MAKNSTVKVKTQAAKGTAATTGLICAIMRELESGIDANYSPQEYEYSCAGANTRPTSQKAGDTLQSYLVNHSYRAFLYPDAIGYWLRGAGFACSTAVDTPVSGANTHTFTIENEADMDWLTILHEVNDYEHRTVDARVNSLVLNDSQSEVAYTVGLTGLLENEATGAETNTDETAVRMLQRVTSGDGMAVTAGGVLVVEQTPSTRPYQAHTLNITNSLAEEPGVYTPTFSDLTPSLAITGSLEGIEVDADIYDILWRAGIGNTTVSQAPVTGSVVYSLESSSYITGTTPYKLSVNLASAGFKMASKPRAAGGEKIRFNLDYYMIDNITTPISIALVNGITAYT